MLLRFQAARNRLQLLAELLRALVMLLDLVNFAQKLVELRRKILVGDDELRQHQHVLDQLRAVPQIRRELNNFPDHQRRARESLANGPLASLVALGQLDFAFARRAAGPCPFPANTSAPDRLFYRRHPAEDRSRRSRRRPRSFSRNRASALRESRRRRCRGPIADLRIPFPTGNRRSIRSFRRKGQSPFPCPIP